MGLTGTLATMPLAQLLGWVRDGHGTGTLQFQRANVCKRIVFRNGRVIACSNDDPPTLMGQFLLSRGRIDQDTLTEGLARQELAGGNLGQILFELGAITSEDRARFVKAKVEEAIFGLFDWEDAVFEFRDDELLESNTIEVDLDVDRILHRGRQRKRQARQAYALIRSPETLCRRRDGIDAGNLGDDSVSRRIFELLDGKKTLREIQLHSRTSEFVLNSSIGRMLRQGWVEVIQPPQPELEIDENYREPGSAQAGATDDGMDEARRLIRAGRHEAALDLLQPLCEANPEDQALMQLLGNVERLFQETVSRTELPPTKIPVLVRPPEQQDGAALSAEESYLFSVLDGSQDIRALTWLAPLRAVDLLRCLRRLLKRGVIEVLEPRPSSEATARG